MSSLSKNHLIALFIIWLFIHVFLFQHYGVRSLFDAGQYLERADYLLTHGSIESARYIFYIVFYGFIACFHWLFSGSIVPFLIFQSVVSGLATVALYYSAARCFKSNVAGLLSGIIFLVWWDNIHWNVALMTESLLCSFTCFLIYCLTCFRGRPVDIFRTIALAIIILFIRPTGVIIVVGVVAFFIQYYWHMLNNWQALKISIVSGLIVLSCTGAYVMFTLWDFTDQYNRGNVITFADEIDSKSAFYSKHLRVNVDDLIVASKGYHPIYKMVHFAYYNPGHFFKASLLKLWYLLSFVRPYYSNIHNLVSIIWVLIIYVMFYLGLRKILYLGIKLFVIIVILLNCLLIAISTVDWDNRFYIPMEPAIVLMAGGGLFYFLKGIESKLFKSILGWY